MTTVRLRFPTTQQDQEEFTRLVVYRSAGSEQGPWEPLTRDTQEGARLPRGRAEDAVVALPGRTWQLDGKTLDFRADGFRMSCTFVGADLTTQALAAQLEAAAPELRGFVTQDGYLVVATRATGQRRLLECLGGTAAEVLGFALESSRGFDQHPGLQDVVEFEDLDGESPQLYRAQFLNHISQQRSELGEVVNPWAVELFETVQVYLDVAGPDGLPLSNRVVQLVASPGYRVQGSPIRSAVPLWGKTSAEGRFTGRVMPGDYAVYVENDRWRVRIPADAVGPIDLSDPSVVVNDELPVVTLDLPAAPRRTL